MLKGEKGFIFAISLALLLSVMTWVAIRPATPILPSTHEQIAKASEYSPGSPRCLPSRLRRLKDSEASDEIYRCEMAAEEHRLKSDDLVQQTRSADAAVAMVDLTYKQTLIALAGSILGLLTLVAAAFVAWYARKAANSAADANSIISRAEDASLVINFPDGAVDPAGDFLFDMVVTNVGRSATTVHSLTVSGEKIFMETVFLAGEQKRLNQYVVINAADTPKFSIILDQTTALRPRFKETMNFIILRPQIEGPRSTWWALRTDNLSDD